MWHSIPVSQTLLTSARKLQRETFFDQRALSLKLPFLKIARSALLSLINANISIAILLYSFKHSLIVFTCLFLIFKYEGESNINGLKTSDWTKKRVRIYEISVWNLDPIITDFSVRWHTLKSQSQHYFPLLNSLHILISIFLKNSPFCYILIQTPGPRSELGRKLKHTWTPDYSFLLPDFINQIKQERISKLLSNPYFISCTNSSLMWMPNFLNFTNHLNIHRSRNIVINYAKIWISLEYSQGILWGEYLMNGKK